MTAKPTPADHSASPANRSRKPNPQPLDAAQIADSLLKMRTASAVAGLSESTLYRMAKADPTFPRLVKLGARCTRIRAGDLIAWLAAQGAQPTAGG